MSANLNHQSSLNSMKQQNEMTAENLSSNNHLPSIAPSPSHLTFISPFPSGNLTSTNTIINNPSNASFPTHQQHNGTVLLSPSQTNHNNINQQYIFQSYQGPPPNGTVSASSILQSNNNNEAASNNNGSEGNSNYNNNSRGEDSKTKPISAKRLHLPKQAKIILRQWLDEHFTSPYPSDQQKEELAQKTGLTLNQVNNWFVNARVRIWKPKANAVSTTNPESSTTSDKFSNDCDSNNSGATPKDGKKRKTNFDTKALELVGITNTSRINPNNANVTRTNIVGSLPNGLPTPSTVICRGNLPKQAVDHLQDWLFENFNHPYPSDKEKEILAGKTNLNLSQVNNWFINARRRVWKPILDKMKSQNLDKDDLMSKGQLSDTAKRIYKTIKHTKGDSGKEPSTPLSAKSKSNGNITPSNFDSEAVEPAKKKQKGRKKKSTNSTNPTTASSTLNDETPTISNTSSSENNDSFNNNSLEDFIPITFQRKNLNKENFKKLLLASLKLKEENEQMESEMKQMNNYFKDSFEEIFKKNIELNEKLNKLEQHQNLLRKQNEALQNEIVNSKKQSNNVISF
ncbi:hypothetical protein ABK040_010370 [Willaertia magna]